MFFHLVVGMAVEMAKLPLQFRLPKPPNWRLRLQNWQWRLLLQKQDLLRCKCFEHSLFGVIFCKVGIKYE